MKKAVAAAFLSLSLLSSVSLPTVALAQSTESKTDFSEINDDWGADSLTPEQTEKLLTDVGLTRTELQQFPQEILEELLNNDAKKLAENSKEINMSKYLSKNNLATSGEEVDGGWLELNSKAFEVKSDDPDKKKFYFYGKYEWTDSPAFDLTDAVSIGFPDSAEFVLPMSSRGKVREHETRYCYRPDNDSSAKWKCSTDTSAHEWDNGMGVGNIMDLEEMPGNLAHKGYIGQYVYTERKSGYVNIKFEYGHQAIDVGNPEFAVYPAGLSIQPESVDYTFDYGLEFEW